MKNYFTLLFVSLITFCSAQDCNEYFPLYEGFKYEMTHYNKKNKVISVDRHAIKSVEVTGDRVDAVITVEIEDKKGRKSDRDLAVVCENGVYTMDMRNMLDPALVESMGQDGSMDAEIEGTALAFPEKLEVGTEMEDANITFTMGPMKGSMDIYDRKVTAKETITTSAGSFECYKIEYATKFKMLIGMQIKAVQWIAPKVGLIKSESYNKKGKLVGTSVLTNLTK